MGDMSLLVVGAGPAGIAAALQARELGARATLVEADQAGGTSLNRGPAPVRTLARAARLVREGSSWPLFGLEGEPPTPNLGAVLANSARVARYAHDKKDLAGHIRRHGIDLVEGLGTVAFTDPHTVRSRDGHTWHGDRVILAVGGAPVRLPVPGAEIALTYGDIRSLTDLPGRAAVVGGADTGCQIASILADFGVAVELFEAGPSLIASADSSISTDLRSAFERKGIKVHTQTSVEELRHQGPEIGIRYKKAGADAATDVDAVFFAVGWRANIDDLGLQAAGVTADRRAIPVDAYLRTNVDHIFAAGDVNGRSMLVQTARLEGRVAAHNAVEGATRQAKYDVVPSASFTDPEYGAVGLTEQQAVANNDIVIGVARYEDLLRPVADGRPEGFCKLIVDRPTRVVLGAHVIGDYSAEIVQMVAACMAARMPVEQIAELQLAYPTFTEAVTMAAQMVCRTIGVGQFPEAWSYLRSDD
jgi:pyruvate/2-oxoglutarate dehydrogenase complex dihydrolipoamide dehydrogenase (E3) component